MNRKSDCYASAYGEVFCIARRYFRHQAHGRSRSRKSVRIEFVPKISDIEQGFYPGSFERHKGQVYPKDYPVTYYLIALSEKSYVSALVENSVVGSVFLGNRRSKLGDQDTGGFPGRVKILQLISRKLESQAGVDLLK